MANPQTNEGAATKPSMPSPAVQPGVAWLSKLIGVQGPLIGLVVLCIFFSFSTSGAFFSVRNGLNILDQVTVLGILSLGMTAVIISGGIDLSVGSVLAFAMMVMGWLSHDHHRAPWGSYLQAMPTTSMSCPILSVL